jgi:DNA-binding transcriptional LysR family regulator
MQSEPDGPVAAVRSGHADISLATAWDFSTDPEAAKHDPSLPIVDPGDGIDLIPLLDEQILVALPTGHRLAECRRVRLHDLRDETWIEGAHPDCLGPVPNLTEALGRPPRVGFTCDDWNGKQALVAAAVGITLVPTPAQPAIRQDVTLLPTAPPPAAPAPLRRRGRTALSPACGLGHAEGAHQHRPGCGFLSVTASRCRTGL